MLRVSWPTTYKAGIAGATLYVCSLVAYRNPVAQPYIFALLCVAFFLLAQRNVRDGLGLLLIELLVGSHGRLLSAFHSAVSLRMAWFVLIIFVYIARSRGLFSLRRVREIARDDIGIAFVLVALAVAFGVTRGLAHGIPLASVVQDANGYFYLALAPLYFSYARTHRDRRFFISVIIGALAVLSFMTFALFLVFSNVYLERLAWVYSWARATYLAEITWAGSRYFRVFLPSQVWLMVGVLACFHVYREIRDLTYGVAAGVLCAALALSLSRSFAVGMCVGIIVYTLLAWRGGYSLTRMALQYATVALIALACVLFLVIIPGNVGGIGGSALLARVSDIGEPGIQSRLNQFGPLVRASLRYPFLGSGFGATATYQSVDPRVRALHPDGMYTTYAFELGYMDMWFKLGALGVVLFLFLCVRLTKRLLSIKKEGWVWLAGLAALLATHAFSPYLNHPLGLGYIIIIASFYYAHHRDSHSEFQRV